MSLRKIFTIFAVVLLFAGAAFAFPHDPNPSAIDEAGRWGSGSAAFVGFTGTWSNRLGSLGVDALRVLEFMNQEFNKLGGPGGSLDMKIWNSPSFSIDKVKEDAATWEYLLLNPGASVPATVGLSKFTTHDELIAFIEDMPRNNLTVEYLGEIPRGFPFPFLIFSTNSDRSPEALKATGKPLVWIQGNIHGGEWSGGEGMLTLGNDLARGRYDNLLAKVNVVLTPRVCTDGAKIPQRATRDNTALQWTAEPQERDLNRDHLLLDLPVTRAMKKMFVMYAPHFAVDLHERGNTSINANVTSRFGVKIDNDAGDVGSAGVSLLQLPRDFVRLRYEYLEPDLAKLAEQYGLYFGLYREGTDNYAHGQTNNYTATWANWNPLPGEPTGGVYAAAGLTSGFVTSSTWDPDAPYFVIPEAQFNARNSRNNNAMPGVISQLFENKSGPTNVGNRGMWERRVAVGYVCALSTITTAANRADVLMPILTNMRKQWIEKGKTVTTDDMIPILPIQPKPIYWNQGSDVIEDYKGNKYLKDFGYKGRDYPYTVIDITGLPTTVTGAGLPIRDGVAQTVRYDATKAMKYVGPGLGLPNTKNGAYIPVSDDSGAQDYQMFKFEWVWMGYPIRERIRPYAYLMDGPYAMEIATRMSLCGITVKRLAKDTTVDVEAWHYNQRPYVDNANSDATGWRNRDVTIFDKTKLFKKDDTFVIYLAQPLIHLIPNYMEPDMPWNCASCIILPYMSLALGGAGSGSLHPDIVGKEMPVYRYLKTVDLPTYDMNHWTLLINRGAVARFYSYQTQESTAAVRAAVKEKSVVVYDYDVQVHTRTDALVNGKFNIMLPTSEITKGYYIYKKDGTYDKLVPNSTMLGSNVATVTVADHGRAPFTINLDSSGNPVIGDGANRTLAHALPPKDDLIGVRIVAVVAHEILDLFKEGKFPENAVVTEKGFEYEDMLTGKTTILSDSMLDGWRIVGVTPQSGTNWKANIVNGEVVLTFSGEAYYQAVTVSLEKIGSSEKKEIEIEFSGERENIWDRLLDLAGCNAGVAMLSLFVIIPLFVRRKEG